MTSGGDTLFFNGVDAISGRYLRSPVAIAGLLRKIETRRRRRGVFRQLAARCDPQDLAQAGWGILFARDTPSGVRQALAPLIALRRSQAAGLFQEIEHEPGKDLRLGFGAADPARLPYYLLIVGSPEAIPWELQYQLDVQHAVGRLWLRDSGEYRGYVNAVLAAEGRTAPAGKTVVFAPRHAGDPPSALSADELAAPLARQLDGELLLGDEATREALRDLLGGGSPPGLLLTAGHGIGLRAGAKRQEELQGALLCQGWEEGRMSAEDYFSAADVPGPGCLGGMIAFLFACYSAGTPRWDSFSHLETGHRKPVAERPFLARLPQRLLASGALAVIGHVDQAWPCSFLWRGMAAQLQVYESTLGEILRGSRVGAAMEYFGQRYAEIGAALSSAMEPVVGSASTDLSLLKLWIAHNDARSFALLGDPAVRLVPAAPAPAPAGPPDSSAPPGPSRTGDSSA